VEIQEHFYTVNNTTLHVVECGDKTAPAILFLHGFPSFWYSWQQQMEYFVAKGYRVIVPDQRGYNTSSKPQNVRSYRLHLLVEDMVQLLALANVQKAFLVGHDWGGIVAWALIKKHPQLFYKAVIINAPYLPAYARSSLDQLFRSWYVFFFQVPYLPEWAAKRNDYALLANALVKTSLPHTFPPASIDLYKQGWQQKGSIRAMINWYRALAYFSADAKQIFGERTPIQVPVMVLWGTKDAFLRKEAGICPAKHCAHFSMKEYTDATHWLPIETSREVNEDMRRFFTLD
jgi:pimeloyl-ACP methyl ester carboxylesterase